MDNVPGLMALERSWTLVRELYILHWTLACPSSVTMDKILNLSEYVCFIYNVIISTSQNGLKVKRGLVHGI